MTIHNHSIKLRHAKIGDWVALPLMFGQFAGYDLENTKKVVAVEGTGRPTRPECAHMGLSDDTRTLLLVDVKTCIAQRMPHFGTRVLTTDKEDVAKGRFHALKRQQEEEMERFRRTHGPDSTVDDALTAMVRGHVPGRLSGGGGVRSFSVPMSEDYRDRLMALFMGDHVPRDGELARRYAAVGEPTNNSALLADILKNIHAEINIPLGAGKTRAMRIMAAQGRIEEQMRNPTPGALNDLADLVPGCGNPDCPVHGNAGSSRAMATGTSIHKAIDSFITDELEASFVNSRPKPPMSLTVEDLNRYTRALRETLGLGGGPRSYHLDYDEGVGLNRFYSPYLRGYVPPLSFMYGESGPFTMSMSDEPIMPLLSSLDTAEDSTVDLSAEGDLYIPADKLLSIQIKEERVGDASVKTTTFALKKD
jgi:hypothetical protein